VADVKAGREVANARPIMQTDEAQGQILRRREHTASLPKGRIQKSTFDNVTR
jgi:hypothetical protein